MSAARRATYGEVLSADYERPAPRRETWRLQFIRRCKHERLSQMGIAWGHKKRKKGHCSILRSAIQILFPFQF